MKFSEIPYRRPDFDRLATALKALTKEVQEAGASAILLDCFRRYAQEKDTYSTALNIAYIRHSIDTTDHYYDSENDAFDRMGPVIMDRVLGFYRAVLDSPFREALSEKYGTILLEKMALAVKSSDGRLIALQQEENALVSRYEKRYAGAQIPLDGKVYTVAQLTPLKQDTDPVLRKRAYEAEGHFFKENQEALDEIYDQLVKNRSKQAKLLGYDSFTSLGDIRLGRLGYSRKEIAACREAVAKEIVPIVAKLKQAQAARLGVPVLHYYDDTLSFLSGNPTPKGSPEALLKAGQEMYRGLSPETAEFIDFMMENQLFDVLSTPGKAPGGYCTQIPEYSAPFIFSNFNGTFGDVDVLTHEAGHAFAAYRGMRKNLPEELVTPGLESCEIHSMSMEFLTAGAHHLFFQADTEKYSFSHLEDALVFLPYGCQVDAFQEAVYENPEMTPTERNQLWLRLDEKFRPWNRYGTLPFYGEGAGWQRQMHIYSAPFYYIDYVLAQAVALQFYQIALTDPKDAWDRYLTLLECAGTASYPSLVHAAGLRCPYEEGTLSQLGEVLYQQLKGHPLYRSK